MIKTIIEFRQKYGSHPLLGKLTGVIGIAIMRFGAIGLSLAFSVVAARVLGTADFGRFVSIWAITGLFVVATGAGLPQLIQREIAAARGSASIGRLVPLIHGAVLLLGLGAVAAAAATLFFFGSSVQIAALFVIAGLAVSFMGATLTGYEFVTTFAWVELLIRPAAALAMLAGIASLASLSVELTLAAQLFGCIAAGIIYLLILRSTDLSLLRRTWNASRQKFRITPEHKLIARAGFHFAMI